MNETPPGAPRALHLLLGLAVAGSALAAPFVLGRSFGWGRIETVGLTAGLAIAAAGLLLGPRWRRATAAPCLGALLAIALVWAIEGAGRLAGYDFSGAEAAYLRIPTFFRQARVPVGEAYFRRRGPQQWRGQVLDTRLNQIGIVPNPYGDEEPVVVDYDADGFRNPPDLDDWEVAVVGDSFTELGYLNHEDLFTTVLAEGLGVRVKNLGVSMTGALSQACYFEEFGIAPSTRHLVVVFFVNDPLESSLELEALRRYERTGVRELREDEPQTSALRAVYRFLTAPPPPVFHADHATFGPDRIPVSAYFAPRHPDDLEPELAARIDEALNLAYEKIARLAREHGITPWLVYMPCKARVHYGQLEFTERAQERVADWKPSRLPDYVRSLAEAHGLRFFDLTPILTAEAQQSGELLYNSMYDMHLNRRGSHIVGRALIELLREGWDDPPLPPGRAGG